MKKHSLLLLSLLSCVTFGLSSCSVNKNEIQDNINNDIDRHPEDKLRFVNFKTANLNNGTLNYEVELIDDDIEVENIQLFVEEYDGGILIKLSSGLKGKVLLNEKLREFRIRADITYMQIKNKPITVREYSKIYYNNPTNVSFYVETKHIEDNIYSINLLDNLRSDNLYNIKIKELGLYDGENLVQTLENKLNQEIELSPKTTAYDLKYTLEYIDEFMLHPVTIKNLSHVYFDVPDFNLDDINLIFEPQNIEGALKYTNDRTDLYDIIEIQAIDKDGNIVSKNSGYEGYLYHLINGQTYTIRVKVLYNKCTLTKDFKYIASGTPFLSDYLLGLTSTDKTVIVDFWEIDNVFIKPKKISLYHGEEFIKTIENVHHAVFYDLVPGYRYKVVAEYDCSSLGVDYGTNIITKEINTTINGNDDIDIYFDKLIKEDDDVIYSIKYRALEGYDFKPTGLKIYNHNNLVEGQVYDELEGRVTNLPPDVYDLRMYYSGTRSDGSIGENFRTIRMDTADPYKDPTYEFDIAHILDDLISVRDHPQTGPTYLTNKNDSVHLAQNGGQYNHLLPETTYTLVKEYKYYNPKTKSVDTKIIKKDVTTLPRLAKIFVKYFYLYDGYAYYEFIKTESAYNTPEFEFAYVTSSDGKVKYQLPLNTLKGKTKVTFESNEYLRLKYSYGYHLNGVHYQGLDYLVYGSEIKDLNLLSTFVSTDYADFNIENYFSNLFTRNIVSLEIFDDVGKVNTAKYDITEDKLKISNLTPGKTYKIKIRYSTELLPIFDQPIAYKDYETTITMMNNGGTK